MPWIALTRAVSPTIADCEISHIDRTPIDVARAIRQHAQYERTLAELGCDVRQVSAAPDHPDAVFIEDTAVVLDELAIITRPGAESRRGETAAVVSALQALRPLAHIEAPGTVDGGDVLVVGRRIFVGRTERTNDQGIAQLRDLTASLGYLVVPVAVHGCLHLKTAVTALDDHTVLYNPAWVDAEVFAPLQVVAVPHDEPMAANVVRLDNVLVYAESYPRSLALLRARGYRVVTVPADELAKAEGAVTCCSLLLRT